MSSMPNPVEPIAQAPSAPQDSDRHSPAAGTSNSIEPLNKKGDQYAVLIGLFLIYGITTAIRSMRKFWYDELFTFHMSQRPGAFGFWAAVKGGADFNPPLGYMVTKAFQFLFGNLELPTRMPALFGFFIMSLCLYRFIARRSTPAFGYVAAVLPWCSGAYFLASQARAYGLVLGFAGLALVCWQEAASEDVHSEKKSGRGKRAWSLLGLCLSLTAALLSHCYASLILFPFGIAELVRQYRGGRFDPTMWVAVLAPAGCVAVYFPLLSNLKSMVSHNYLFDVPWTAWPLMYGDMLVPLLWPLAISAIVVALPAFSPSLSTSTDRAIKNNSSGVLWHEWAIAGGFALVPAVAVGLAKIASAPFFPRYGAPGAIGCSLLFTLYLRWRRTPARAASIVTVVFLACYAAVFGTYIYDTLVPKPTAEAASLERRERHKDPFEVKPELPFVVASALEFLEIDHYAKPDLAARLYYLTDENAALEYTQTDGFNNGFPRLQKWFPMRAKLAPYQTFIREHQHFLVYGLYAFPSDWVIKKLIDDGADVRLISDAEGGYGDNLLFEVTPKQ
jgi:hypothetical protein